MQNLIPSCHLPQLFPGIPQAGVLELDSRLLDFAADAMPLALPYENLVLAALCRHLAPGRMFEFGTALGRSTLILARNSPAEARVITIDLPEADLGAYSLKCMEGGLEPGRLYKGQPCAAKIHELRADSRSLDTAALVAEHGRMDLVLVDGDHTYEGVRADTQRALELAHEDTVFLWHDFYLFPDYVAETSHRGVYPWLNAMAQAGTLAFRHILGTYFVAGRARWPQGSEGRVLQPTEGGTLFNRRIVRLQDSAGV